MQFGIKYSIIFLLLPIVLSAHGVDHNIITKGIGVEVKYSDGELLSYCETEVYSPDEPDDVFQKGLTDANGRFMFYPDKKGIWKVVINDGMGHGKIVEINVKEDFQSYVVYKKQMSLFQKIITGVGIIGLIFTLVYIILTKRKQNAHT